MRLLLFFVVFLCAFSTENQAQSKWNPEEYNVVTTSRDDHRFLSTFGFVHSVLQSTQPKYAFNPNFTIKEVKKWQKGVRCAMQELMSFPELTNQSEPQCLSKEQREGYRLEKWEYYPLPGCVSTFLALIPDHLQTAVPAVLCIPGSGGSKEGLAGEPGIAPKLDNDYRNPKVTMALNMVKAGFVAIAVDNPAAGECSDLERYTRGQRYDYDLVSRYLLELGWHYLGYTSFLDYQVLQWMKKHESIRKDRIVVSGFSLGTEPLMVLGMLDPTIYAFIYNDFLCQTQERAEVMTAPNKDGLRPFPNSIRHLIPNFWKNFNFPDIVAALAPRPLIFTEGGLDRDLNMVRRAYELFGKSENIEIHHYPKFADPASRKDISVLPEGLDRDKYYQMVNVDGPNHYYKSELIIPWLKKMIGD